MPAPIHCSLRLTSKRARYGGADMASSVCTLPAPSETLADSGLTVQQFLKDFRSGERYLAGTARACTAAQVRGMRLEIHAAPGPAGDCRGQSIAALPFELLANDRGFLFRRACWSTLRCIDDMPSHQQRERPAGTPPKLLPGWANVLTDEGRLLPPADFSIHEAAVVRLGESGRALCLEPIRRAARRSTIAAGCHITEQTIVPAIAGAAV